MVHKKLMTSGIAIFGMLMAISTAQAGVTVLQDNFNSYHDVSGMRGNWVNTSTTSPNNYTPELRTNTSGTNSYLSIRNGIVSRSLGTTLTDNWTMSFSAMQGGNSRGMWAALMNDAGTQGYLILWDSGGDGKGSLQIRKLNLASTIVNWGDIGSGTLLKSVSGSASINTTDSTPTINFSLSWDKATGTLTAKQNDNVTATVVDTSFSSFSKIYLRGNGNGNFDISSFDNILVTNDAVPEAASLGVLGLGVATLTLRRR